MLVCDCRSTMQHSSNLQMYNVSVTVSATTTTTTTTTQLSIPVTCLNVSSYALASFPRDMTSLAGDDDVTRHVPTLGIQVCNLIQVRNYSTDEVVTAAPLYSAGKAAATCRRRS